MKSLLLAGLCLSATLFAASCKKIDNPHQPCDDNYRQNNDAEIQNARAAKLGIDVPAKWYALAISLSRVVPNQNVGPTISRTFGYMGISLYESVVPGLHGYQSIQPQLNGLAPLPGTICGIEYFYPLSANTALAGIVRHMFGNTSSAQSATIDSLEKAIDDAFHPILPDLVYESSVSFGRSVSDAIYSWSTSDGGDKSYLNTYPTTYTPPVGPGLWVPQPGQSAQLPYWGKNRLLLKMDGLNTDPPKAPPAYSTDKNSAFYKEESEVYHESINQDPEHTAIAKYWAALPPPCVSLSILTSVLAKGNYSFATAAEAYCRVGIATADAMVVCYKTKYTFNQLRPISYIRKNFDTAWKSLIPTPPFPDYTSAHSVQTGAVSKELADIFGDNTSFTDNSINDLGFTPRSFTKFSDYANEVGLSRIYGGIHLRSSDFIGLDQGALVAKNISRIKFKKN